MIIDSYVRESKKGLSVGAYSLYALDPVHTGMHWQTATVTLAQWEAKGKTSSKLPMKKPIAKFMVKKAELMWQLPLLEQVLEFVSEGESGRVFRFISLGDPISNQKDWMTLKNNCRVIREEKERGLVNG